MTQIYATTSNFLGQAYALLVADRRQTTTLTVNGITAPLAGKDRPCDEINKIQSLGNIAYAYSGELASGSFEDLNSRLKEGTWKEALQIVQAHFGLLAKNIGKTFSVVVAGYDRTRQAPRVICFEASNQGIVIRKQKKIISANPPSEYRKITIDHFINPKGTVYADHVLFDGEYSPKLDFAIDTLRESILEDSSHSRDGISRNVNIALVGPNGILEFDDYENFPDAWLKEDTLGYQRHPFPKAVIDFKEQSKRRVLDAPTIEDANSVYRVVLSGLKSIVRDFIRYVAVAPKFYTRRWENDPIKIELFFGGAPRGLLSKHDLEKRLRLIDKVTRPILQEVQIS